MSFLKKLCILYLSENTLNSLSKHPQNVRFKNDVKSPRYKLTRLVGTGNKAHPINIVDLTCLRFYKNYEVYKTATPIG